MDNFFFYGGNFEYVTNRTFVVRVDLKKNIAEPQRTEERAGGGDKSMVKWGGGLMGRREVEI